MGKTRQFSFTHFSIERLPKPSEKRLLYRDSKTRGLWLMIQPSGHRSFLWYRKVHKRPTWKTIGTFPDLSVENARAKADEFNGAIARWKAADYKGLEPIPHKRGRPHALTLGVVFEDYVEKWRKVHAKNPDRGLREDRWKFDAYLSHWRNTELADIQRSDIRGLHDRLGAENGKFTANRVLQFVRTLFNWAWKQELWHNENPAKGIARFPEASRTRFIQPQEMKKFLEELSKEKNSDLRDFVVLSLFTGARRSNTLSMRWDQVDLRRALWTIPDPKNRVPYVIPLTGEAIAVLKERQRRARGDWVFPSTGRGGHLTDVKHSWKALITRAKIDDLRIHDLRRTLGSWQAGAGTSLPIIGKSLGHQSGEATEVYARLQIGPVRDAIREATRAMLVAGKMTKHKLLKVGDE